MTTTTTKNNKSREHNIMWKIGKSLFISYISQFVWLLFIATLRRRIKLWFSCTLIEWLKLEEIHEIQSIWLYIWNYSIETTDFCLQSLTRAIRTFHCFVLYTCIQWGFLAFSNTCLMTRITHIICVSIFHRFFMRVYRDFFLTLRFFFELKLTLQ